MPGRKINEDKVRAKEFGLKTYTGAVHSKCGTTDRYTSGGGCVHCARIIATEQREARKFLQSRPKPVLDNPLPTELREDDAAERERHSIDELM